MPDEPESQIPILRAEKPKFLTQTRFDEFDLPPEVLAGLDDAGFIYCTPIQAQTLPVSLAGRDVAGRAQTGTGKTAAFLVTLFTRLLGLSDRRPGRPSALIVAPTRELALQIYRDIEILGRHTGFRLAQAVGGVDYLRQAEILRQGVDIIIGTPGRIIDYSKQGILKTSGIKVMVIDEADRLFDLGFTKDMRYILRKLPHYERRQSMLFSATLSYRVMELTYEYMNLPEIISVTPEDVTVEGVEESLFHVGHNEKLPLLLGLLDREEWSQVLIFVNTKAGVEWLSHKLKRNGWPAEGITGDLPQRKRFRLMEQFKDGKLKILVATDVASRGIHVDNVSHVINYDLPQDIENYIHRIGRTARAGKTGHALAFACDDYVLHLEPLEQMLGYEIPVVWPEDDWFVKDKSGPISTGRRGKRKRTEDIRNREKKRPTPGSAARRPRGKSQTRGTYRSAKESKNTSSSSGEKDKPARKRRPLPKKKSHTGSGGAPGSTDDQN